MKLDYDLTRKLIISKYWAARKTLSAGVTYDDAFEAAMDFTGEMVAFNDLMDAAVTGPAHLALPTKRRIARAADSIMKRAARRQREARRRAS